MKLGFVIILSLCLASLVNAKKKKSKAKKDASLFDSKTLNCLVCKALVEEIDGAINKVDPAKKVESGSQRLNGDGTKNTKLVSVKKILFEVIYIRHYVVDSIREVPGAPARGVGGCVQGV